MGFEVTPIDLTQEQADQVVQSLLSGFIKTRSNMAELGYGGDDPIVRACFPWVMGDEGDKMLEILQDVVSGKRWLDGSGLTNVISMIARQGFAVIMGQHFMAPEGVSLVEDFGLQFEGDFVLFTINGDTF